MREQLLVICGQTGTGKTSLAFYLADLFAGELVSADSRQVYKNLDIGTGKDLLKGSAWDRRGFYDVAGIRIWGYDLVDPKRPFSVGQYLRFAKRAIAAIQKRGKLPIVVGGTGLFIKGVVDGIATAFVPRNDILRKSLADKKAAELFEILAQLDPIRAGSMNASDRANPRRLTRAIEIAQWSLETPRQAKGIFRRRQSQDVLLIGLTAPKPVLEEKIEKRVEARIKQGLEKEIKSLLASGVKWEMQSMSSLGYRQWQPYFRGERTQKEAIANWKKEEIHYARRQLTWFKKDKRIKWFDVSDKAYVKNVEKLVKKWYAARQDDQKG